VVGKGVTSFKWPTGLLDPLTRHMRNTEPFKQALKFMQTHGMQGHLPSVAACLSGNMSNVRFVFLLNFPPSSVGGMNMNRDRGMAGRSDESGHIYEPCIRMLVSLVRPISRLYLN